MSKDVLRRAMLGALIAALHLPLIYYALSLHAAHPAARDIVDLAPLNLLILFALFILPHLVLRLLGVHWNPERARLGEYDT